jgi:two-component system, LytTR family, sensor kinase
MRLIKTLLLLFSLGISTLLAAQDQQAISEQLDSEIGQLFISKEHNPEAALQRAYEIDEISESNRFHNVRIRCLNLISIIHMNKGMYAYADSTLNLAHTISSDFNDSLLRGSTLVNWAKLDMIQADYLSATDKVLTAKSIFEVNKRVKGEIHCAYLLAQVHFHRQLYSEAKDDLVWGIDKSKLLKDTVLEAAGLVNLGLNQKRQGQQQEAIKSLRRASSLLSQSQDKGNILQAWLALSSLYADLGKEEETLEYIASVRKLEKLDPHLPTRAEALLVRSTLHHNLGEFETSILFADSAWVLSQDIEHGNFGTRALDMKQKSLYGAGKYRDAYQVLNLKNEIVDSTVTRFNQREINELEKMYRDATKDHEILLLQTGQLAKDKTFDRIIFALVAILIALLFLGGWYMFRNRQRRLNDKFDKIDLEQKALKAQMNPHFIFNALNSIQSSILNEDRMIAYEFHNKFTKLMRRILTLSREEFVSMRDELETLKLYIDLERYRADNAFDVEYQIDEAINLDRQKTPSLLFQPYVENAIWHGMMPNEQKGELVIKMEQKGNLVMCYVRDNGMGRTNTTRKSSRRQSEHESVGMEVTETRIKLFNRKHGKKISVHISDIAENGKPAGTEVQFSLPHLNE